MGLRGQMNDLLWPYSAFYMGTPGPTFSWALGRSVYEFPNDPASTHF